MSKLHDGCEAGTEVLPSPPNAGQRTGATVCAKSPQLFLVPYKRVCELELVEAENAELRARLLALETDQHKSADLQKEKT